MTLLRWNLFLAGLLLMTLMIIGLGLDRLRPLTNLPLFTAFTLSSGLGIGLAAMYSWRTAVRERRVLWWLGGLYVAWRLVYLPALLVGATVAAIVEGAMVRSVGLRPWVYPTLLVALAALQLGAGMLVALSVQRGRLWALPPLGLLLICCGFLSIGRPADLHPLPDRAPWLQIAPAPLSVAGGNSHWVRWRAAETAWHQRPWTGAAAVSFAATPRSPWSSVWKGTLAHLAASPTADSRSGTGRLQALYQACRAAHRFLGSRRLEARSGADSDHCAQGEAVGEMARTGPVPQG